MTAGYAHLYGCPDVISNGRHVYTVWQYPATPEESTPETAHVWQDGNELTERIAKLEAENKAASRLIERTGALLYALQGEFSHYSPAVQTHYALVATAFDDYRAALSGLLQLRRRSPVALDTKWEPIESAPERETVMTKIDDDRGVRNEQRLRRNGNLWFLDDGSRYVYYTPTHWAPLATTPEIASGTHVLVSVEEISATVVWLRLMANAFEARSPTRDEIMCIRERLAGWLSL